MSKLLAAIGRKMLGLALIFNSIVSLTSAANILASFYAIMPLWQPYSPYLIDGSLFWFVILTAALNIVSAKLVGKTNIKRVFFHHYVYGLLVSSSSLLLIAISAPAYILILLVPSLGFKAEGLRNIPIYAGLFFLYGGLTLMIDDIQDVSLSIRKALGKMKMKIRNFDKTLQIIHLCSSLITLYVAISCFLWYLENYFSIENWPMWELAYITFIPNLFVTAIWGLKSFKVKIWVKVLSDLPKKGFSIHKK